MLPKLESEAITQYHWVTTSSIYFTLFFSGTEKKTKMGSSTCTIISYMYEQKWAAVCMACRPVHALSTVYCPYNSVHDARQHTHCLRTVHGQRLPRFFLQEARDALPQCRPVPRVRHCHFTAAKQKCPTHGVTGRYNKSGSFQVRVEKVCSGFREQE